MGVQVGQESLKRRRTRSAMFSRLVAHWIGTATFLLASFQVHGAKWERLVLPRPDGSEIHYYVQNRESGKQPVLLIMQGSDCNSIARHPTVHEYTQIAPGHAVLYVDKYGITDELPPIADENREDCPGDYLVHDRPQQRVLDYLRVIAELRRTQDWWNGDLVILAGSSGTVVGEQVAVLVPEVRSLVLLGLGSRWFLDDLTSGIEASLANAPGNEASKQAELQSVLAMFEQMRESPSNLKFASGHSHAYWASLMNFDQLNALRQVEVPVLAVQGARDENVSAAGAKAMVRELEAAGRSNISYREYEDLDHGFVDSKGVSHKGRVIEDIRRWLLAGK